MYDDFIGTIAKQAAIFYVLLILVAITFSSSKLMNYLNSKQFNNDTYLINDRCVLPIHRLNLNHNKSKQAGTTSYSTDPGTWTHLHLKD